MLRKPLALSLAAGLILAGSVATAAYAAGSTGAGNQAPTTQTQVTSVTTPATSGQNDPAGADVQSGLQQGDQSQVGLDTEAALSATGESDAASSSDPLGGPDQNVQQGGQSGAQDGSSAGQ